MWSTKTIQPLFGFFEFDPGLNPPPLTTMGYLETEIKTTIYRTRKWVITKLPIHYSEARDVTYINVYGYTQSSERRL